MFYVHSTTSNMYLHLWYADLNKPKTKIIVLFISYSTVGICKTIVAIGHIILIYNIRTNVEYVFGKNPS